MNGQTSPLIANPATAEVELWAHVERVAHTAVLDPSKFGDPHRAVLHDIVHFLASHPPPQSQERERDRDRADALPLGVGLGRRWRHLAQRLAGQEVRSAMPIAEASTAVPPIIIAGEPGTGKTTFLGVLDVVLRQVVGLPDNLRPEMRDDHGRVFQLHKRTLANGLPSTLLSVRKWSELLHFYLWDTRQHRLVPSAQSRFIQQTLLPMRVLFADEVEMFGYAPTIPDLARHGLLVVGTSNQYAFQQLEQERIYRFGGVDMRAGNPAEAVVTAVHPAWPLFEQLATQPVQNFERLAYQTALIKGTTYIRLDFQQAVQAPLLEAAWSKFLTTAVAPNNPLTLLLDQFSLDILRTDYNAIIRFVTLLDVIEQLALGVLVRHPDAPPELSRAAITHMKVTIETARGVTADIKKRTVVGLDRATSRLGQASQRADKNLSRSVRLADQLPETVNG